jgi:hypothetical protein
MREAEERWTAHVTKTYLVMLMRKAKSWFTGYNSNVPGHEQGKVRYFVYNGGAPKCGQHQRGRREGLRGDRSHLRVDAVDRVAGRAHRRCRCVAEVPSLHSQHGAAA